MEFSEKDNMETLGKDIRKVSKIFNEGIFCADISLLEKKIQSLNLETENTILMLLRV